MHKVLKVNPKYLQKLGRNFKLEIQVSIDEFVIDWNIEENTLIYWYNIIQFHVC